ncbi:flagellar hook protein FliD [Pseudomonas sp. Root329]|jgi:flagellar hook-associated protein 2|uniref:flagellar filament capping protein FliD n=1 Tax=Pseudomonas sp. Root329 TaxID=1736515 RepID=UPI00070076F9|nr:flagellar filament capping protein FliD [Pseudomonas sp. Root329]KQV16993.1 flagellar hook protein FliD [Pseudomonas sp. Root329]
MASPILPGLGLGSGIDTAAIVKALVAADKEPKQNQITKQVTANTASISAVGQLKSALQAYQTAMNNLNSKTTPAFLGFAATSSDTKFVTAVSDNSAVTGNYAIDVTKLATSSKVATATFAGGASSAIAVGTLTINQNGTDYTVDVPANSTLQTVRDAINSKLQANGISANIVNDGSGSRMVIGSTTTGKGSDIVVSGIASLAADGKLPMTAGSGGYVSALADDAAFTVDGMSMTSKSNTVGQAVSGLSFSLVGVGKSTVSVATNTDGLKASLQTFVDSYNNLVKTVNSLTKTTKDADGNLTVTAPLTGDATARALLSAVRNELVTVPAGSSSKLSVLSQLGINTLQADGTLEFSATKFSAAMNDKKLGGEIQSLFNGDTGLLARMNAAVDPYVTTDGLLDKRTKSLNNVTSNLSNQQIALDSRIASLTEALSKKYNAMDTLVGKLKATADNIKSMFEAMNAQKSG